jgi:O-antigen ligase
MIGLTDRLLAFGWLVVIGSNWAQYYSKEAAYQAVVILAGAAYFAFIFQREFLRLVFFKDYLLVLSMLVIPFLLMLLSDRSFDRGAYTSQIAVALVFVVASVLALRADLDRTLAIAAFVIVTVGAALNVYELIIENNIWSIAPGRSAGFYVNPNISSEALIGYGLVFLTGRVGKLRIVDLTVIVLVVLGVLTTFSRAGILASFVLLTAAALMRVRREYVMRTVVSVMVISLLGFAFTSYVIRNLDLSKDATIRIQSLLTEGGVGDYEEFRGVAAAAALDLIDEDPVFGAGVQTIYEMPEGPHNMFLAMMVDYGIFGLIIYLVVIIRLILTARRADREVSGMIWLFVAWLLIFSFASHNLLGTPAEIPLMGFALARAYQIQASAQSRCFDR